LSSPTSKRQCGPSLYRIYKFLEALFYDTAGIFEYYDWRNYLKLITANAHTLYTDCMYDSFFKHPYHINVLDDVLYIYMPYYL
jgi:hypothetical protein